jgi:NAD(P)-dependent dehydrogenase (short-subunit alcohol dehydrogenase family)
MTSILVFGGVGGIGEAVARRLRTGGRRVVVTSRDAQRVAELADQIGAVPAVVDVHDEDAIGRAVATAAEDGKLAGLVYAVGSIPMKPLARTTADDMLETYRLNVVGALMAVKASADALKAGNGAVVLFSSVAARQGFTNHAAIGAAKAAVEGLTLSLAAELAPHVRVNAIAPSLVDTPLAKPLTANTKMAEAIAALHPIPRLGDADEIAAAVVFLLSPDAAWITGQVLGIDGGRSVLRVGRS